jgi:hypothetical protein
VRSFLLKIHSLVFNQPIDAMSENYHRRSLLLSDLNHVGGARVHAFGPVEFTRTPPAINYNRGQLIFFSLPDTIR